jgi:hypothetical protein
MSEQMSRNSFSTCKDNELRYILAKKKSSVNTENNKFGDILGTMICGKYLPHICSET